MLHALSHDQMLLPDDAPAHAFTVPDNRGGRYTSQPYGVTSEGA